MPSRVSTRGLRWAHIARGRSAGAVHTSWLISYRLGEPINPSLHRSALAGGSGSSRQRCVCAQTRCPAAGWGDVHLHCPPSSPKPAAAWQGDALETAGVCLPGGHGHARTPGARGNASRGCRPDPLTRGLQTQPLRLSPLAFVFSPAPVPRPIALLTRGLRDDLAARWKNRDCDKSKSTSLGPLRVRFRPWQPWHRSQTAEVIQWSLTLARGQSDHAAGPRRCCLWEAAEILWAAESFSPHLLF